MNPIRIPLCTLDRNVIFSFNRCHKGGIKKRVSSVFFMFLPDAIRFLHTPLLP
jgi:hypothetical protein